jgi:type II secretory pathway pseudopilin PulG
MELIMVVIILGILVSLSTVTYQRAVLGARDREARAMLRLIQGAERMRRLEGNRYLNCTDTSDCNAVLNLNLPVGYWEYNVTGANETIFCAQATHDTTYWHINESMNESASGSCP